MNAYTIALSETKQVDMTVDEYGSGQPFLILHGGAGLPSVIGLAQRLAASERAHVYVPTHPGFNGTNRPEWVSDVGALAAIYSALIDHLDLHDVTVIGSSIGGWIGAEMALLHNPRIRSFILIDPAGIAVEGQPVIDIFSLTPGELSKLSYHNPAAFGFDPSTLTDVQKRAFAANRQTLAVYGGQHSMSDPTLLGRLSAITAPVLMLWGDSDGIVTPTYGRAYAAAIPTARFQLMPNAGHLPQIETPDAVVSAVWDFVTADTTISSKP